MTSPCVRNCPDRKMMCRSSCDRYKEYEAWKQKVNAERRKENMLNDYTIKSTEKRRRK